MVSENGILWFSCLLIVVSIFVYLTRGKIGIYMAPEEWQEINRKDDPGRFWLFVVALTALLFILILRIIFR
jgi:hypothetical protein